MKLASRAADGPDGRLLLVSRDLSQAVEARAAPTTQAALDRSASARAAHAADAGGNLIDRIRAFFAMRDAAA